MRVPSFEHLEADRVRSADELLVGIDAEIEVVEEQIVVGAIRSIGAAQQIGVGWLLSRGRRCRWCSWLRRLRGKRDRSTRQQNKNTELPIAKTVVKH